MDKFIEAILFLKGSDGITIKELATYLKITTSDAEKQLTTLIEKLKTSDNIYAIKTTDDLYRLTLKSEISKGLSDNVDNFITVRLSKSVMETLTIIAYKQPITKPEIESIRGVSSEYAIGKLVNFEIIRDNGKSNLPGHPKHWVTTTEFLKLFNLTSLDELPSIDLDSIEQINQDEMLFNTEK